ncbi:hypothetical protein SAMN05421690_1001156 [Nitrosomonas sp. Nm51]|uniref:AAA family ATPase n=1 Tax=Nitrosomonas sp. Nm51 TaxID=133720 RepID=UPI0008C35D54|nr:MoxR family ATPase [Nitrosomonas sp. Nm51]SEQ78886.1 hypothetical protein SAMN05421690_1001156 [Nitrosomonas sp. Nm51]
MSTQLPLENFFPQDLKISNPSRQLHHLFDERDCYALWAAYSAGRPLLVRGKPGTGKSQLARAIAEQLGWAFVSEVIRGNTELSDLHWHFDAIGRLGEAQARGIAGDTHGTDRLDPLNFLSPGAFWWAFHWKSAEQQYTGRNNHLRPKPEKPDATNETGKNWQPETGGVVLLLDEIDKAEPDLPNGLLETLGQYRFTVPYLKDDVTEESVKNPIGADPSRVLIVITTNEERELPSAFVRRCFVHTLTMEDSTKKLENGLEARVDWLVKRGQLHFGARIADDVYKVAADLLWKDRTSGAHLRYPPGLAEYIDLLNVLRDLPKQEQKDRLQKIACYALQKEAGD